MSSASNVQIATDDQSASSVNAGVGFAVPSNTVKSVVGRSDRREGRPARLPRRRRRRLPGPGAAPSRRGQVREPGRHGRAETGDVITAIDGNPIADANALTAVVSEHQPGDTLQITVQRNGSTVKVTAKLGTRPASTTA